MRKMVVQVLKSANVAERFDEVLLAILIGNNIVNLASASLATIVATEVLHLGASGAPNCHSCYDYTYYYLW